MAAHKYLEQCNYVNSITLDKIAQSMDNLFLKCHSLGPLFESRYVYVLYTYILYIYVSIVQIYSIDIYTIGTVP